MLQNACINQKNIGQLSTLLGLVVNWLYVAKYWLYRINLHADWHGLLAG
jgi:hypothetical protein